MTLEEGLLRLLNNHDEPVPKRLKIADNAFHCPDVKIQHRELFLLKWLAQTEISRNSLESWRQCAAWLSSESFREIRSFNMEINDIKLIVDKVAEQFKSEDEDMSEVMLEVANSLYSHHVFQEYFRSNSTKYLAFLAEMFQHCASYKTLLQMFARQERLFGKRVITVDDFADVLIQKFFRIFVQHLIRFESANDLELFEYISSILQKHVFVKKSQELELIFKSMWSKKKKFDDDDDGSENSDEEEEEEIQMDKSLLDLITAQFPLGEKCDPKYVYHAHRLIFHAFVKTFKLHPMTTYKFFAHLVQNLGFSSAKFEQRMPGNSRARLDLALWGLCGLLETIARDNLKISACLNGLSFVDHLQHLLQSVIATTKTAHDAKCFEIVDLILKIAPMVVQKSLPQVLRYLMCSNSETHAAQYASTMSGVFEMLAKAKRDDLVISKMRQVLQPIYSGEKSADQSGEAKTAGVSFVGKVPRSVKNAIAASEGYVELDVEKLLPAGVLEGFGQNALRFSASNINNMFKILMLFIQPRDGEDLVEQSKKARYVAFVELASRLLCRFLERINVASSNFRTQAYAQAFDTCARNLREVLEKFGSALVEIEHNKSLMKVFLQLSFLWGELEIVEALKGDEPKVEVKDVEVSACNIACLHSYLSSQTWCLIAERISNFGELPCKQIMKMLWIQKIRFLILNGLDAASVNEHISALIAALTPIEDHYEYLLSNNFASRAILTQMDQPTMISIAECVVKDANQSPAILKNVLNHRHFVAALLYAVCKKINKTVKKEAKSSGCQFISCSMFSHIGENLLQQAVDPESRNLRQIFVSSLGEFENTRGKGEQLSLDKIKHCLSLIKQLPVVYLDKSTQLMLYCYLFGLFLDAGAAEQNGDVREIIEHLLLGIAQLRNITFGSLSPTDVTLDLIFDNFAQFQSMFSLLLLPSTKDNDPHNCSHDILAYMKGHVGDERRFKCLLHFMKHLQKNRRSRELVKNIQEDLVQLADSLLSQISQDNSTIYLELLIYCLQIGRVDITETISSKLANILSGIFTDNGKIVILQGELSLFTFALTNETLKCLKVNGLDLVANIARALEHVKVMPENVDAFTTNVVSVLQKHDNIEELSLFMAHVLERTIASTDNPEQLPLEVQTWLQIISTPLKSEKTEVIQIAIEKLLETMLMKIVRLSNPDGGNKDEYEKMMNVLIDFDLHLLQNGQKLLSSTSLDICFATVTERMQDPRDFEDAFRRSVDIVEVMLKHRQTLICDRLPALLQEYRFLVRALCKRSDTSDKERGEQHFDAMAELAHLLEKFTIKLCKLGPHMASLSMYVVAEILHEYETITIYPAVKLALNNCLHNLIALCNEHGVACLLRTLSAGSAEIFKVVYDDYKKYHRFTGKV